MTTYALDLSFDKGSNLTTEVRIFTGTSGSLSELIAIPTGNFAFNDFCDEAGFLQITNLKTAYTIRNLNTISNDDVVGALAIKTAGYIRYYRVIKAVYLEGAQNNCTLTLSVDRPKQVRA